MKVSPRKAPRAAASAKTAPAQSGEAAVVLSSPGADKNDLSAAADVLFGTEENPILLRDGRTIIIGTGKIAHVGLLLSFFNALVEELSKDDIITLVKLIEEQRTKEQAAKKEGAVPPVPKTIEDLVQQAFSRSSLLVAVFQATNRTLPAIVAALTKLTKEEYENLDMDEGILLAVSIFQLNYSFFSRNLPHAVKVFLALAGKKVAAR